ncbi:putative glycosyltransferase 7 [Syzygium oleosum]|uniref:putative glycosyltransferase 7 n=1 Tax=Syzygium oleosum TaxID=219896 RepID=UPI0024B9B33F|nr:putative glycosyltransferase 7 [Syzygium oleosum]
MVSPESQATMAKHGLLRNRASLCFGDGCLFLGGVLMALLLVWSFSSFSLPPATPSQTLAASSSSSSEALPECASAATPPHQDSEESGNFYDDPELSYSFGRPVRGWDEKRLEWLRQHPSLAAASSSGGRERVLLVTGSQPAPCKNKIGDHLLLRFFKNKVDYCRLHGCDVFYNNALLQPRMFSYWAKYPVVRAAMVAHPEAEWIWWVDSDALFSDMDFELPLDRYKGHNLVVHGWQHLIYEKKSWTSINAGVFLIRNCQWSMDFMDVWAGMGPQSPEYERWGHVLRSTLADKLFPESDDQSALVYLLLTHKDRYGDKIYVESEYYFEGYWEEIVGTLPNITREHHDLERRGPQALRRRHAEKASRYYAARRAEAEAEAARRRRPFVTHFTGCQPCSGDHNQMYSGESCWDGMVKALNFADNQVLRRYGYVRPDLMDSDAVKPVPFG